MRALVFDFLSPHAEMLLAWTDRASATLDRWEDGSVDRQALAVDTITETLAGYRPEHQVGGGAADPPPP